MSSSGSVLALIVSGENQSVFILKKAPNLSLNNSYSMFALDLGGTHSA